ncbi:MAG: dTMP kinase [Deltaproteobacteria bacterium]|nr:dTMP kinase [Deltaproteobacteria bacterium]MCL5792807.1 dTMP kinase [Deltaproteobacteria bacterium]
MKEKGLFITFEGIDGSGKTTQLELLYEKLLAMNKPVIRLREPGSTELGEKIRNVISDKYIEISDYAELLLFFASRVQLIKESITPALEEGKIVLCDRFNDATIAYQSYGRGLPLDIASTLEKLFILPLKPDVTFLLDCRYETAVKRMSSRANQTRIELLDKTFFKKVKNGYLELAKNEPERFVVINADEDIMSIHENKIMFFLKDKGYVSA